VRRLAAGQTRPVRLVGNVRPESCATLAKEPYAHMVGEPSPFGRNAPARLVGESRPVGSVRLQATL
jgi:hypothetical protein